MQRWRGCGAAAERRSVVVAWQQQQQQGHGSRGTAARRTAHDVWQRGKMVNPPYLLPSMNTKLPVCTSGASAGVSAILVSHDLQELRGGRARSQALRPSGKPSPRHGDRWEALEPARSGAVAVSQTPMHACADWPIGLRGEYRTNLVALPIGSVGVCAPPCAHRPASPCRPSRMMRRTPSLFSPRRTDRPRRRRQPRRPGRRALPLRPRCS